MERSPGLRVELRKHLDSFESKIGLGSNTVAEAELCVGYLAGGRSGLSAHFRAAGSCSGSSSQLVQT